MLAHQAVQGGAVAAIEILLQRPRAASRGSFRKPLDIVGHARLDLGEDAVSARYSVLSRSKIQFLTWRKSGRIGRRLSFSADAALSMAGTWRAAAAVAQAPLTRVHHASLRRC